MEAIDPVAGEHEAEPDAAQDEGHPQPERDHEDEPVDGAPGGDRGEEDDQGVGRRDDPAGKPEDEQAAPGHGRAGRRQMAVADPAVRVHPGFGGRVVDDRVVVAGVDIVVVVGRMLGRVVVLRPVVVVGRMLGRVVVLRRPTRVSPLMRCTNTATARRRPTVTATVRSTSDREKEASHEHVNAGVAARHPRLREVLGLAMFHATSSSSAARPAIGKRPIAARAPARPRAR